MSDSAGEEAFRQKKRRRSRGIGVFAPPLQSPPAEPDAPLPVAGSGAGAGAGAGTGATADVWVAEVESLVDKANAAGQLNDAEEVRNKLHQALETLDEHDNAKARLKRAEILVYLARLEHHQKNHAAVEVQAKAALALLVSEDADNRVEMQTYLGWALRHLERYPEAQKVLNAAYLVLAAGGVAKMPESQRRVRPELAWVEHMLGNSGRAIELIDEALELSGYPPKKIETLQQLKTLVQGEAAARDGAAADKAGLLVPPLPGMRK